ncbi:MAG: right-handed parallel beta-helix repeat-containing protein [Phycisphaerales bacterium]
MLMAVLHGQAARAGSIYSSQDFESTSFAVGTVNGQDANGQGTWMVVVAPVNDANIVDDFSRYGQQSIQLKNSGNRVVARLLRYSGITTNHYADAWIYPPRIEEVAYNTALQYRDGAGVIIGNVQFTKTGTITVNGVSQGVKYRPNEWNRITVGFDMVNHQMNVYVNHQLAYTGTPMFAAPSSGIRYYDFEWTGTGVGTDGQKGPYLDHFYISDENPLLFVSGFGAVGDGTTDDKPAIQTALNTLKVAPYAGLDNVTVAFDPDKTYMLGSPTDLGPALTLAVASNFTIEGQNAVLLIHPSIPPDGAGFGIRFDRCHNARLLNLVVDGNRAARGDGGQVWAHNIILNAAEDMLIDRVISLNATVDGFYIDATTQSDPATFSKRLHFIRCGAYNCNRQGMSVINSKDVVIEDSWFHGTHGLDPQAGIDIESNAGSAVPGNSNVVIKGCSFTQNTGFGLQISSAGGGCVNVSVEKNSFEDNHGTISLGGSYCKVIGNTFGPSNGAIDGTGRVLDLRYTLGTNHDNLVADNRFINLDHIPSPDNGVRRLIYVHSGAGNNNVIINNAFIDCDLEPTDTKILIFNSTTITRNNTVNGVPFDAVYGQ